MQAPCTEVCRAPLPPAFQLTVITVCRNVLDELMTTVESVLRQKAKDSISIEHVVVDGASTDGTPEWLAQQLAAGRIECYVSEPDCGIYDAMNKGINLARGEVLAFLNAGDWYLDADLAPCVLPICKGDIESVAASTDFAPLPGQIKYGQPQYRQLYFRTPCCHQAFFASRAAYCRLKGYDAENFICYADADFMYRLYREQGEPLLVMEPIVHFSPGGLSNSRGDLFSPELVELWWRNRNEIAALCRKEAEYRRAFEALLTHMCKSLHDWQVRHDRNIPEPLSKLRELCLMFSQEAHSFFAKASLWAFGCIYLPHLTRCRRASSLMFKMAAFLTHACFIPEDNPYKCEVWNPNTPITALPGLRQLCRVLGRNARNSC